MQFDIDKMAAMNRYELLLGTVVPRPIALITTISSNGAINAAPYSLFNVMGHDPANLVSETLAQAMNITCIDAPPGTDELELSETWNFIIGKS